MLFHRQFFPRATHVTPSWGLFWSFSVLPSFFSSFFLLSPVHDFHLPLLSIAVAAPLWPATTTHHHHYQRERLVPATLSTQFQTKLCWKIAISKGEKSLNLKLLVRAFRPPPTFKTYKALKPSIPETSWCLHISISTTVGGGTKSGTLGFGNFRRRYLTIYFEFHLEIVTKIVGFIVMNTMT